MENNLSEKVANFLREIPHSKMEIREISNNNTKIRGEFWSIVAPDFDSEKPTPQLFAIFENEKKPARLNLRCDANLAKLLREKYESASAARALSPRRWIALLLTGQIADEEIRDLILHAASEARQDTNKDF